MRLWLLAWPVAALRVGAFVHFHGASPLVERPSRSCATVRRARSLLDDPLLLSPSSEPGKEHEVVVSDSPAFGLQRTLYRHQRRLKANGPRFKPGDYVYMSSGPYRNARGTVLSTIRRAPGEPYFVNVVLDCRNERGIVRSDLSDYHGRSLTVSETQLTARPFFSPYSPPPVSTEDASEVPRQSTRSLHSTSIKKAIGTTVSQLINCPRSSELHSYFRKLVQLGAINAYPYVTLTVQLSRSLPFGYDKAEVRALTTDLLPRLLVSLKDNYNSDCRGTLPWLPWSLRCINRHKLLGDMQSYMDVFYLVRDMVLSNDLKDLKQKEIALLSRGFRDAPCPASDVLHRLAMLYSYFPASSLETWEAATVACNLSHYGVRHSGFTRLLCDFLGGDHPVLSPDVAVYMLLYLSQDSTVPKAITDQLLACTSVSELMKPTASPHGHNFRAAVGLARHSASEMAELCNVVRDRDAALNFYDVRWCLHTVRLSSSTCELLRLILVRFSASMDSMREIDINQALRIASRLREPPLEFVESLERYLGSMADDRVLDSRMLHRLTSLVRNVPDTCASFQREVLRHAERFIRFFDELLDRRTLSEPYERNMMRDVTRLLRNVPVLGFELPSLACASASLLRKALHLCADRAQVASSLLSIQAMSRSYFEEASESARQLLSDPSAAVSAELSPMAELLLMVKGVTEGASSIAHVGDRVDLSSMPAVRDVPTCVANPNMHELPVFFSLLVRSRLLDERSGVLSKLYVFAEDNLRVLSNVDLVLMRDSLVSLGALDEKWTALFDSLPKGIDAVTVD